MDASIAPATSYFNPRSPHGERLGVATALSSVGIISTHAPRTGSDPLLCKYKSN